MEQIFELYTDSKNEKNVEEIKQEVANIMSRKNYGFDQLARYAVKVGDNRNILVELDVPEIDEEPTIYITAYEYSGDLQDFDCSNEIGCIDFNGDWHSLKAEMSHFADEMIKV